eukprot:gene25777-11445_t
MFGHRDSQFGIDIHGLDRTSMFGIRSPWFASAASMFGHRSPCWHRQSMYGIDSHVAQQFLFGIGPSMFGIEVLCGTNRICLASSMFGQRQSRFGIGKSMFAYTIKPVWPSTAHVASTAMWIDKFHPCWNADAINELHENPKYLPGVSLSEHVVACPDLVEVARDADILIFCTPHQFVFGLCKQLSRKSFFAALFPVVTWIHLPFFSAFSFKGMRVGLDGPQLISQMISKYLGVDCSVMMGANIAADIGQEQLSEAVIGYYNMKNAQLLKRLFHTSYFKVSILPDAPGVELCGTLKNIVAVAAGIVDGLGYGNNTKAAIMRLSKALYPTIRDETFLETCGVGDLIATCYGGRNRRVAMEWAKAHEAGQPKSFVDLEKDLLNGQKLQGLLTSNEIQETLEAKGWEKEYPLFTTLNRIVNSKLPPSMIVNYEDGALPGSAKDIHYDTPKRERMEKLFDKWMAHWMPS